MKPAKFSTRFRSCTLIIFALALAGCEGDPSKGVQASDLYGHWVGLSNGDLLSLHFFEDAGRNRYELLAPEGLLSGDGPLDNVLSAGIWAVYGQELQFFDDGTDGYNCPPNSDDTYKVFVFNNGTNFTLEHFGTDCLNRGLLINRVDTWTRTDE
ncbi:hypothetical protein ACFL6E_06465 [Candidatus Neomarinimicrobiota bacterium]